MLKNNRKEVIQIIIALILIAVSAPIFIFTQAFPTISPEIGSHQISSWLGVTLDFIGFGILVYNMGKLEI